MKHETITMPVLAHADGVFFITIAQGDRLSIATTIERLIDMLDALEPDPELEGQDPDLEATGDDEPSIGWPERGPAQFGFDPKIRLDDDCELDDVDYEDGADSEPTLGAPERHVSTYCGFSERDRAGDQLQWADGDPGDHEREEVSEDEAAQCDDEGAQDERELDVVDYGDLGFLWGGNEDAPEARS